MGTSAASPTLRLQQRIFLFLSTTRNETRPRFLPEAVKIDLQALGIIPNSPWIYS